MFVVQVRVSFNSRGQIHGCCSWQLHRCVRVLGNRGTGCRSRASTWQPRLQFQHTDGVLGGQLVFFGEHGHDGRCSLGVGVDGGDGVQPSAARALSPDRTSRGPRIPLHCEPRACHTRLLVLLYPLPGPNEVMSFCVQRRVEIETMSGRWQLCADTLLAAEIHLYSLVILCAYVLSTPEIANI